MEIIENLFRSIMFFFDNIIYGLIPIIYKLFIYLSELNLYSDDPGNPLYQLISHVYVLLGIFMLFKVSFSLLQYLVDPNSFRDSSKGMGKLATNVIVALVLLVTVPYIFSMASELQRVVVQENVIGQLILGTNASGNVNTDSEGNVTAVDISKAEEMAKDLQFMLYGAFYNVSDSIDACSGTSGVLGSIDVATQEGGACLDYLNGMADESNVAANGVNLYSFFKHTPVGDEEEGVCNGNVCDERQFEDFGALLWWKDNGGYVIDYLPFISSAVGVYVVFLLISFAVDIAVRAIKLCFLQMVAPIAIVSYVDPKESIGNGKLNNWIKECASTYFSLFMRLATIFFVMLLVQIIASSVLSNGQSESYISMQITDKSYSIWIYLFLVIGAFMFAKQVPNIIEKIFGIKGSGDFNLNPFKNTGFAALAGGVAGLGIGVAGAVTGSGFGRIATGTLSGFKGGLTGKNMGDITKRQADANRRLGAARANGSTFTGRMGAKWSSFWGTPGAMGRVLNKQAAQDEVIEKANRSMADNNVKIQNATSYADFVKAQEDRAESQITDEKNMTSYAIEYRKRQAQVSTLEAQMNATTNQDERVNLSERIQELRNKNAAWLEGARYSYMDDNKNNRLKEMDENGNMVSTVDHVLQGLDKDAMRAGEVIGIDERSYNNKTAAERHKDVGMLRGQISDWKRENLPYESQKRTAEAEKEKLRVEETKARADIQGANAQEGGPRRRLGGPRGPMGPRGPRF